MQMPVLIPRPASSPALKMLDMRNTNSESSSILQYQPIRGQYQGHVITLDQSEASTNSESSSILQYQPLNKHKETEQPKGAFHTD